MEYQNELAVLNQEGLENFPTIEDIEALFEEIKNEETYNTRFHALQLLKMRRVKICPKEHRALQKQKING